MKDALDCARDAQPSELEPYGDIAGIGVIIGFMVTVWLVVAVVLLHYLLCFNYTTDVMEQHDGSRKANPVDRQVLYHIRKFLKKILPRDHDNYFTEEAGFHNAQKIFIKIIAGWSDTQMLTGLGILVSCFVAASDGLSAHHFQIATNLAWFSNLTYFAAMTFLRGKHHQTRPVKITRWVSMTILTVMTLVATIPTAWYDWVNGPNWPVTSPSFYAACFPLYNRDAFSEWYSTSVCASKIGEFEDPCLASPFHRYLLDSSAFQSTLITCLLLLFGYASSTYRLMTSSTMWITERRKAMGRRWREATLKAARKALELASKAADKTLGVSNNTNLPQSSRPKTTMRWMIHLWIESSWRASVSIMLWLGMFADIFGSAFFNVYWLLVSAVWGTRRLVWSNPLSVPGESDWTFGQVLPVFLLVAPIFTMLSDLVSSPGRDQHTPANTATDQALTDNGNNSKNTPTTSQTAENPDHSDDSTGKIEKYLHAHYYPDSQPGKGSRPFESHLLPPALFLMTSNYLIATVVTFIDVNRPSSSIKTYLTNYALMAFVFHPFSALILIAMGVWSMTTDCISTWTNNNMRKARALHWLIALLMVASNAFYLKWEARASPYFVMHIPIFMAGLQVFLNLIHVGLFLYGALNDAWTWARDVYALVDFVVKLSHWR
ncbi:hypothetical protein QBC41DRAFT_348511 [Cercophora samala]|uniref:Uncharacterized protein n=1 Tax=Cercophora samala TaxID=330535 RepID=A0AA39ZAP8_9PEZI|nr:hypothetical protein QBC41DRAFT_348511 [Cercophora samala]